jgi:hypothetical protein
MPAGVFRSAHIFGCYGVQRRNAFRNQFVRKERDNTVISPMESVLAKMEAKMFSSMGLQQVTVNALLV